MYLSECLPLKKTVKVLHYFRQPVIVTSVLSLCVEISRIEILIYLYNSYSSVMVLLRFIKSLQLVSNSEGLVKSLLSKENRVNPLDLHQYNNTKSPGINVYFRGRFSIVYTIKIQRKVIFVFRLIILHHSKVRLNRQSNLPLLNCERDALILNGGE